MDMVCKCGRKEFFIEEHGMIPSPSESTVQYCENDAKVCHDVAMQIEGFQNASLLERLKARIAESAIKVSTVKAPHTYMKAVGTRELEKILEEELGNEDTK